MQVLRSLSSGDICSSTVSVLLRSSEACPCFIKCLSSIRHFAAVPAYAHDCSSDEECQPPASNSLQCQPASNPLHWKLQAHTTYSKLLWQEVSGISAQQAQQLLHQQPHLQLILHTNFHHTNHSRNVQLLQRSGISIDSSISSQLRAYISLVPPSIMQELISRWPRPSRQHHAQELESRLQAVLADLPYIKHRSFCPQRATAQHMEIVALLNHMPQQLQHVQQQQQQQPLAPPPLQQLATAVTDHLGLREQPVPQDLKLDRHLAADLKRSSRSSRSSSSQRSSSPVRQQQQQSQNSSSRSYSSAAYSLATCDQLLTKALERSSNALHFKGKAAPSQESSLLFLEQLQQHTGMTNQTIFELVLKRPSLFWTAAEPPGPMLQLLQQRLPQLAAASSSSSKPQQQQLTPLAKLLIQHPTLATCIQQHVADVLTLLLDRLKLSEDEAAAAIITNPRLLLNPVKVTSLNLGFLVGLGFKPADMKQMIIRDSTWMTRPLSDVTRHWQFVNSMIKVGSVHCCCCCCYVVHYVFALYSIVHCESDLLYVTSYV